MALILTVGVFLTIPTVKVQAASDTLNLKETITTEKTRPEGVVYPGDELTVKVSMDNYADLTPGIRGIQIDLPLNTELFEFVDGSIEALLNDPTSIVNEGTLKNGKTVTFLYAAKNGDVLLPRENSDIFSFKVKIRVDVADGEAISFPIDAATISDANRREIANTQKDFPTLTCKEFKPLMVQTMPTKTTYIEGQELDLTGGELLYTSEDGTETTIAMTDPEVSVTGYDKTKVGEQTLTVAYKNEKATFAVTVKEKSVTSIEVTKAPSPTPAIEGQTQTNYIEGQVYGIQDDGKLKVNYDNNTSEEIAITEDMVTAPDMNKVGDTEVTVNYKEKTTTYPITIEAKQIMSIAAVPNKVEPKVGTTFDPSIVSVKASYNNGLSDERPLTEAMLNAMPDMNKLGEQVLTITYEGKTTTLTVNVIDKELVGIEMEKTPDKTEFIEGTAFSAVGGKITLKYDNNTTETKDLEDAMCTGYDMKKVGEQTVTVTYDKFTTTYKIVVNEKSVTAIEMSAMPKKTDYIEAQELDVTGAAIKVSYDNGTSAALAVTADMCSGYDMNKVGDGQKVTVTYGGKTTEFIINIKAKTLTGIVVSKAPQNEYLEGDKLNLKDGEITLKYDNGKSETLAMTDKAVEVTGYDADKAGTQTLTVTYGGKTATFDVKVISREKVDAFIAKADKLDASKLTLNDKDMVLALKAEYEKLSDVEKAAVPTKTLQKLNDAITKINDLVKADEEAKGKTEKTEEIKTVEPVNPTTGVDSNSNGMVSMAVVGTMVILLGAVAVIRKKITR